MVKKNMMITFFLLVSIAITGCGMSEKEKHDDLEVKLYGFDFAVELGFEMPYEAYLKNYPISGEMYEKNEIEKLNKKIESAQVKLETIQKFEKAAMDEKVKLKKGNDIDKDNEFEKLKTQYVELAKELEVMTQFKIDIFKKIRNGQKKFSPGEEKEIANMKENAKQFDDKATAVSKDFRSIIYKYGVAGINR